MIFKALFVLVVVVAAAVGSFFLAPRLIRESCVPLGSPCAVRSDCCNTFKPGGIGLRPMKGECFVFGDSTCQPIDEIPNLAEFFKLQKQLNRTNFEALKDKYWNSVR